MKKNHITAAVCLTAALLVAAVTGQNFASLKKNLGEIILGEGVTGTKMLSDYFDGIKGTNMDTEVYVMEGENRAARR